MTIVSPVNGARAGARGATARGAVFALLLMAGPAWAQSSGSGDAPVPLFQAAPASPVTGATAVPPDGTAAGAAGIQIKTLETLDSSAVGLVDERSGGLPASLWANSHPDLPPVLVSNLPDRIESPTLRDLARRLLVTAAPLPAQGGGLRSEARASDFLARRIEKLIALGAAADAVALSATVPLSARDRAVDHVTAEAALSNGQVDEACRLATLSAGEEAEPFWQRLQVFCQIQAGNLPGAELSTQLLADLGQASPLFLALSDALTAGIPATVNDGAQPDILEAAMMAELGIAPSASGDLATLESETALGAVSPETLAEHYAAADVAAAALANPVKSAAEMEGPAARALLYQAASIQSVPAAKVEIIRTAMETARRDGRAVSLGPVFAAQIDRVQVDSSLWHFAEDAARLYYRLDRVEPARRWHGILRTRTLGDPAAAAAMARLWPHAVIAGELAIDAQRRGLSAAALGWRSTVLETRGDGAVQADRALTLIAALGLPIDALLLNHAFAAKAERPAVRYETPEVDSTVLSALKIAAAEGRLGDTAALAVIAAGSRPASAWRGTSIADVVAALRTVGFNTEARTLALEALP